MPNKYEREIEEILRNMERSAPKPGFGQRIRRKPEAHARRPGGLPSFHFGLSEWCLLISWVAALVAGGWAYAHFNIITGDNGATIVTGSIALVSVVGLILVIILPFVSQSRFQSGASRPNNVTSIHRNPLNGVKTRWNLFVLKLRYRRKRDK